MNFYKIFVGIFLIIINLSSWCQTTMHTIGTGTVQNTNTSYPTPYGNWYFGAKNQFIIQAPELQAAGMSAGNIYSISFDVVTPAGTILEDFEIGLKLTTNNDVSAGLTTGFTNVYGPIDYSDISGWNQHDFHTPFYWDGTSNLLIETCFNNTSWTTNAIINMTTYSYESSCYRRADNGSVCSSNFTNGDEFERPNVIIEWQDPNAPPSADFSVSTTNTCSGSVNFFDGSTNNPTQWLWDFGDGNTATTQNPSHTYSTSGTYTVTLTVTNSLGSNNITYSNLITVNLGGINPIAATCIPMTQDGSLGFGITNVSFSNLNKSSGNAAEGYSDFTCDSTAVYVGLNYNIDITHSSPTFHQCAAWIDFNNDGVFNNSTEQIVYSASSLTTSGNVLIPSNSVLNTPLRMRVWADYDLGSVLDPCNDPLYGQAEDYTIFILQDTTPPSANLEANVTYTCNGTVEFTDLSSNAPFAWAWDFGDGTTSVAQNPTHTYTIDGTYDVQLISTNQYGSDTILMPGFIVVSTANALTPANCSPSTLGYCCKYGINKVVFNSINNTTLDASEGYQDYSCEHQTYVNIGDTYSITIITGPDNPQDTKIWIDLDNNGIFDNNTELFLEELNAYDPTGTITIPSNITLSSPIRMRISSDEVGNNFGPCDDLFRGQTEDYAIIVNDTNCPAPTSLLGTNVTTSSIDLSWNAGGTETQWNIEYGLSGFFVGSGISIPAVTTNQYTVTGLSDGNEYDFYIQADCGGAQSGWVGPFSTLISINEHAFDFKIYPNPSDGIILLSIPNNIELNSINVYNLIGEKLATHQSFSSTNTITLDLNNLNAGSYFIELVDSKGYSGIKTLIIQ